MTEIERLRAENANLVQQNQMLRDQLSSRLTPEMVDGLLYPSPDELEIARLNSVINALQEKIEIASEWG